MESPNTTFKDIAAFNNAKKELLEIVTGLKNPCRFQKLAGELPNGLLPVGPPGAGNALLPQAVAGAANVP